MSQEFDSQIDAENYEDYQIEDGPFRKKIKLDHDTIYQKISRKYPDIVINEQKLQKTQLIFQELVMLTYLEKDFWILKRV